MLFYASKCPSGLPAWTVLPHEKLLLSWFFQMPAGVFRKLREMSEHGVRLSRVLRHFAHISQDLNSQRAVGSYTRFSYTQLSSCFPRFPRSWCCWIAGQLFCLDPSAALRLITLLLADLQKVFPYLRPSPNAHKRHPARDFWRLLCVLVPPPGYPGVRGFVGGRNYLWSHLFFWMENLSLWVTWYKSQSSRWWSRLWPCLNRPVNLQISACSCLPHPDLDRRIWICLHLLMHDQAETARTCPELFFGLSVWNHLHREDCGNDWNLRPSRCWDLVGRDV